MMLDRCAVLASWVLQTHSHIVAYPFGFLSTTAKVEMCIIVGEKCLGSFPLHPAVLEATLLEVF